MEFWTVGQLSKKANVTIRTIRYYDQIQLLVPEFRHANGRRYYTAKDLAKLEQICLLKSHSFSLEDIKTILDKDAFTDLLIHRKQQALAEIKEAEAALKSIEALLNHLEFKQEINLLEHLIPLFKREAEIPQLEKQIEEPDFEPN